MLIFCKQLQKYQQNEQSSKDFRIYWARKIWQKSLVRINFHWPWTTAKVYDCEQSALISNKALNIKNRMTLDIQVLAWDSQKYVAGLNRLMESQPSPF